MKKWQWVICGKHPGLKDYFHLGPNLPMVAALAEWIEKGYRGVAKTQPSPANLLSWRFWTGGVDRNTLLCGILRDSSDSVGRPYPLLVVGSGFLADWEAKWDLVPQACEQSWIQMESLSARIFRNLKQLEDELLRVREPQPLWTEFAQISAQPTEKGPSSGKAVGAEHSDDIESQAAARARDNDILVALDETPSLDPFTIIHLWHASLKNYHTEPPKAVFMGGSAGASRLAFLRRPLSTQDFVRLWSL
jgi:type VI secretion system protein VasJ